MTNWETNKQQLAYIQYYFEPKVSAILEVVWCANEHVLLTGERSSLLVTSLNFGGSFLGLEAASADYVKYTMIM